MCQDLLLALLRQYFGDCSPIRSVKRRQILEICLTLEAHLEVDRVLVKLVDQFLLSRIKSANLVIIIVGIQPTTQLWRVFTL